MIKKIVLMGSPNVGKSVVFSRLTGANVISSNYSGTTVDFSKGKMRVENKTIEIIDAPGTYSLEPSNKAEEVAVKIMKEADVIINVVDSTNLERNLYLTLELLEQDIPVIIALNLWDEAKHCGIKIDVEKLEKILGVPVIPTVALTGEGIKELASKIKNAKSPEKIKPTIEEGRWIEIGHIIKKTEKIEHKHHSLKDKFEDLSIRAPTGIPIAFLIIIGSFWLVRLIGENLIKFVFDPMFEELYQPLMTRLSEYIGPGLLHDFIIGKLVDGEINFVESLGVLTTGLYVPIAMVLPYIFAFYLFLSILEDSGYLPRLATLVDNLFHKLGMHGHGIVPVFLGLGCNVPGALSIRTLETRKQRFISATLLAIAVPCIAQLSMIFAIFAETDLGSGSWYFKPIFYIGLVFLSLIIVYVIMGLILNKVIKGDNPEIFMEIPPYRRPSGKTVLKKTWMRVRWFVKDAIPWLFFGVFIISLLFTTGIIDTISNISQPVMSIFGLPGAVSVVLLTGLLRKDLAVGLLLAIAATLTFNPMQLVIIAVMLTLFFPCVATFTVLIKELGIKDMLKSSAIMIATAASVGIILRIILIGM